MGKTTVMTGFSPAGETQYGRTFLDTFDRHWPKSVALKCYVEQPTEVPRDGSRDLWDCKGLKRFLDIHNLPLFNGRVAMPCWKPRERETGYSYRTDVRKFSRQMFIPREAAVDLPDGDILAWMDADVITDKDVPEGFIESLLGDAEICYLGRGKKHTELGFWACRLNRRSRSFLHDLAALLETGNFESKAQWHSAYLWDFVRSFAYDGMAKKAAKDLTPGGDGHVWFSTPLGIYTDHLKGNRKALGRSPERRP